MSGEATEDVLGDVAADAGASVGAEASAGEAGARRKGRGGAPMDEDSGAAGADAGGTDRYSGKGGVFESLEADGAGPQKCACLAARLPACAARAPPLCAPARAPLRMILSRSSYWDAQLIHDDQLLQSIITTNRLTQACLPAPRLRVPRAPANDFVSFVVLGCTTHP